MYFIIETQSLIKLACRMDKPHKVTCERVCFPVCSASVGFLAGLSVFLLKRILEVTAFPLLQDRLLPMQNQDGHSSRDRHTVLGDATPFVLGENVRRLRKQAKINKQTFALMVGIGRPFLNHIENGTADPRLSVIQRLADALDTTTLDLLTERRSAPASPIDGAPRHERLS